MKTIFKFFNKILAVIATLVILSVGIILVYTFMNQEDSATQKNSAEESSIKTVGTWEDIMDKYLRAMIYDKDREKVTWLAES